MVENFPLGTTIPFRVTVTDVTEIEGTVNAVVTDPDGVETTYPVTVAGNVVSGEIPHTANTKKGKWKLQIREVASGKNYFDFPCCFGVKDTQHCRC